MISDPLAHNLFAAPGKLNFRDAACALILLDDNRYLMQLRDDKPGIFYPDHWGLFGGAMEAGEDGETALRRELKEELGYDTDSLNYFTRMDFGFDSIGASQAVRLFYEVKMRVEDLAGLVLTEGRLVEAVPVGELLINRRVVPYDAFAIWMHHCWKRRAWSAGGPDSEEETVS